MHMYFKHMRVNTHILIIECMHMYMVYIEHGIYNIDLHIAKSRIHGHLEFCFRHGLEHLLVID